MDKPTPSTSVRHNDAYSEAIIDSYKKWMDGDTFQQSTVEEEKVETPIGSYEKPAFDTGTIPTCDKSKEKGDDVSSKLKILSSLCFNSFLNNNIYVEGIKNIDKTDIDFANKLGFKIKLLGYAELLNNKISSLF